MSTIDPHELGLTFYDYKFLVSINANHKKRHDAKGVTGMQSKTRKALLMKVMATSTVLAAMSGCAKPPQTVPGPPETDPAIVELSRAADSIHQDLNLLSRIRQEESGVHEQVKAYKTPPANSRISKPITLSWSGPLEPAVEVIAQKVGYNFRVIGSAPSQPVLINLSAIDKPAFEILEDMGWQAGDKAGVVLNQEQKELQVIYLGSGERIM
jgi:hypothetical protein